MSSDLSHVVDFDLARGSVSAMGAERAVLVPVEALYDLVSAAEPEAVASVARSIGQSMGERLAIRFGGVAGVRGASLDAVINAVALEFSVAGLGVFGIERWGKAMVLVVEHAPRIGGGFIATLLEGVLSTASQTEVSCMVLAAGPVQRILVASHDAIERVRTSMAEGTSWADALSRLQARVGV